VTVRLVQKDVANLNLEPFLESAVADGIALLCFGELAATGCLYTQREIPPLDEVLGKLGKYSLPVMLGLPYRDDVGLRNAYVFYDNGSVRYYHKVNLFSPMNEDNIYVPGEEVGIWETDLGRIGAAICYDIRFDDYFERLKSEEPGLVVIPAAFPRVRIGDWRELLIQRAKQLGVTVLGINAVGNDGTNEFGGLSMAVAGSGAVLAEADQTSETFLDVDI
jgi:predicted amidohydrolase